MNRAQINRRIYCEQQRDGLLGPWLVHDLEKNKRALRREHASHALTKR